MHPSCRWLLAVFWLFTPMLDAEPAPYPGREVDAYLIVAMNALEAGRWD